MTTIPVLMMTGYRLCTALLTEARLAVAEGDWRCAAERLDECASHTERLGVAEARVLSARLMLLSPACHDGAVQLRREQGDIDALMRQALRGVAEHDHGGCVQMIGQLIDALSCHYMTVQPLIHVLVGRTRGDVVRELAEWLGPPAEERDALFPECSLAVPHRLH